MKRVVLCSECVRNQNGLMHGFINEMYIGAPVPDMFCMQQSSSYSWNQLCPLCEKNISLIAVAVAKIVIPLKSLTHPFSVGFLFQRSTFVGSAWSFGLFIPTTTADFFYPRFYPLHLFSYLNS